MAVPFMGEIVAGKSIRKLQEGIYAYMAHLQVPDFNGELDSHKEEEFRTDVVEGIKIARWWLKYMEKMLRGNLWSDEGIALEYFNEWVNELEAFCRDETLEWVEHTRICTGRGCFKYTCSFHRTNSELSLKVFNNYLDYDRHENGELKSVFYLDKPFY